MLAKAAVALAIFASSVVAQNSTSTVTADSVPFDKRVAWCNGQIPTCGYLCSGAVKENECLPETLKYACLCRANGSTPGLQYYKQSLPTFMCQEVYERCIKVHERDKAGQDLCTQNRDRDCGQLNPENFTAADTASTSSSAAASGTPTPSATDAAATNPATTSSTAAAATMAVAREFGTGILAVGVAAAFGLMI